MKVLIDNGHGENTPGKRSPDGRLREWVYSREIADMVVAGLRKLGIDAERIVKEDTDVPLSERCRRANAIYKEAGKKAILVSIHCNAAGNGSSWMSAKGWSVFVSNNASSNSKKLADCLGQVAECIPVPVRKQMPGREYWEQNLAIGVFAQPVRAAAAMAPASRMLINFFIDTPCVCWGLVYFIRRDGRG